jgi:hypothetical protein
MRKQRTKADVFWFPNHTLCESGTNTRDLV